MKKTIPLLVLFLFLFFHPPTLQKTWAGTVDTKAAGELARRIVVQNLSKQQTMAAFKELGGTPHEAARFWAVFAEARRGSLAAQVGVDWTAAAEIALRDRLPTSEAVMAIEKAALRSRAGSDLEFYGRAHLQSRPYKAQLPAELELVRIASVDFGFHMLRGVNHLTPNQSKAISVFSLFTALNMARAGALGRTQEEMGHVLRLGGLPPDRFNQLYLWVLQALRHQSKGNVLAFGNALFSDKNYPVLPEYVNTLKAFYGATAESLDFSDQSATLARINGYIEEQTRQMLKNVVRQAPQRTALVNAGYFKGTWKTLFNVNDTKERDFLLTDGTVARVPLMSLRQETFPYFDGPGLQMVSLPFERGDFAFDLIVPVQQAGESVGAAVERVLGKITGERYLEWVGQLFDMRLAEVALPRFETEFNEDVAPLLQNSMPSAFDAKLSDFGGISRERLFIGQIIHATKLKVNELGSEAGFATVIELGGFSVGPEVAVIADRPFLYVIRHVPTQTVLFVGVEYRPKALPAPSAEEVEVSRKK